MKSTLPFIALVAILPTPLAHAQPSAEPLPETKVVLRVSRDFIHKLTGVEFVRDRPINTAFAGTTVVGSAHVDGVFDVKMLESATDSNFELLVTGHVTTQMTATRRPVVVRMHGHAPFTARRLVSFDGTAFSGQPTEITATHRSQVDQIRPFRRGLLGALTVRMASRSVYRGLPDADRRADDEIRARVAEVIDEDIDQVLAVINKIGPLGKKAEELLIAEDLIPQSGTELYRAATKDSLLFSTGPRNHRIAPLPVGETSKRAPIEVWIARREESKEQRLHFFLKHWQVIVPIVEQQMQQRYPQLAKEFEGKLQKVLNMVHMESVEGWHVVMFCPQLQDLLARDRTAVSAL